MKSLLTAVFTIFVAAGSILGQEPDTDGQGSCGPSGIDINLTTTGPHIPGATVTIKSGRPKIRIEIPNSHIPGGCFKRTRDVPNGNWAWEIIQRPALSTSQLAGSNGLTVTLLLDRVGDYVIRFTACVNADGCGLTGPNASVQIPLEERRSEIRLHVVAIIPPGTQPVLPSFATSPSQFPTSFTYDCDWTNDWLTTPWRTVKVWEGPGDYELLEGRVVESYVAGGDNSLNHFSPDWDINVVPDPHLFWLLGAGNLGPKVAVEREKDNLPEKYRPTFGDRVSAEGYWIYDCGHSAKTEIHPSVLFATHRPRAILLPESAGQGRNVYVPGIITDIYISKLAGNITHDCPATGLHQQIDPSKPLFDPLGSAIVRCLPDSEGFSRDPINKVFEFNIYLPPSPDSIMRALGKTVPNVPLYYESSNPDGFSGGPDPVIVPHTFGDGIIYLKVSINLTNFTEPTYTRRIVAAWEHAAPDNWGARRWVVQSSTSMEVDSYFVNPEWAFWVNTNNGGNEWDKVFDCDNCGGPLNTTISSSSTVILFPDQNIWLATTGFIKGGKRAGNLIYFEKGNISPLLLSLSQARLNGSKVVENSFAKYTLNYQVLPGQEIGGAQLSDEARRRYDQYRLVNNDLQGIPAQAQVRIEKVFNPRLEDFRRSSRDAEKDGIEPLLRTSKGITKFREMMRRAVREKPALVDGFFKDLKAFLQRKRREGGKAEAIQLLRAIKSSTPASVWRKHNMEAELSAVGGTRR